MDEKNLHNIKTDQDLMDDLRKMTDDIPVPPALEPDAVERMLEDRAKKKRRKFVRIYGGAAAAACACVVIGLSAAYLTGHPGDGAASTMSAQPPGARRMRMPGVQRAQPPGVRNRQRGRRTNWRQLRITMKYTDIFRLREMRMRNWPGPTATAGLPARWKTAPRLRRVHRLRRQGHPVNPEAIPTQTSGPRALERRTSSRRTGKIFIL